jgi:hypothetical protein
VLANGSQAGLGRGVVWYQLRFNTRLPENVDGRSVRANDLKSRIPSFPFGKEALPTLVPKPNTPRVGKDLSFSQLVQILKDSREPELVYAAESHRLYFVMSFALTFVVCYNLLDLLTNGYIEVKEDYVENKGDLPHDENVKRTVKQVLLIGGMASIYAISAFVFAGFPTRLVRRIEYLPGPREHIRMVTHPWFPGRPSPVLTIPLDKVHMAKRAKVWTGRGFYGTADRSQFFFFLYEMGRHIPWIIDRSGWFWGDGRVYDHIFGKEPVKLAEKGYSYDDLLRLKMHEKSKKEAELRRELGPAWRAKAMGTLMKEDAQKLSGAAKRAFAASLPPTGINANSKHMDPGSKGSRDPLPPPSRQK